MNGAGKSDLGTIGAFVACISAKASNGQIVKTKQLAYVCEKVDSLYLSKTAMHALGIVSKKLIAAACTDEDCGCPHSIVI